MLVTITFSDIAKGMKSLSLAAALAGEDIKDRYRRSLFGALWISVSFMAFIAIKALIFTQLNLTASEDFLTYLTIGFALWTFISSLVIGASNCFVASRGWILSSNLPYSIYVLQFLLRSLSEFLMIVLAAAVVFLVTSGVELTGLPYFLLGVAIFLINGFALCLCLAPISTRFRDVFYAIQTVMRVLFFATPVIWVPVEGTVLETVALLNPFTHYIEIIRKPLLGQSVDIIHWQVVSGLTLLFLVLGILVFGATKRRIPIWL